MTDVPPASDRAERRRALEDDIRRRAAIVPSDRTPHALAAVGLLCTACRTISAADAQFCTQCGLRFNALVVTRPSPSHS